MPVHLLQNVKLLSLLKIFKNRNVKITCVTEKRQKYESLSERRRRKMSKIEVKLVKNVI